MLRPRPSPKLTSTLTDAAGVRGFLTDAFLAEDDRWPLAAELRFAGVADADRAAGFLAEELFLEELPGRELLLAAELVRLRAGGMAPQGALAPLL